MKSATGGQFDDVPMPVRFEHEWLIVLQDGESMQWSRHSIRSATDNPLTKQEETIDYLCRRLIGQS